MFVAFLFQVGYCRYQIFTLASYMPHKEYHHVLDRNNWGTVKPLYNNTIDSNTVYSYNQVVVITSTICTETVQ
jgi:hypothetical protein